MRAVVLTCLFLAPVAVRAADPPARADGPRDPLPRGCVTRIGTDRMRTTSHPSDSSLAWSPDGKRLAVATPLGAVRVWDAAAGELVAHLDGPFDYGSLAFTPDGKSLLLAERGGVVWRLDPATGAAALLLDRRPEKPRPSRPYWELPPRAVVHPDGQVFFVPDETGASWEARDAADPAKVLARVTAPGADAGLSLAPDLDDKFWLFGYQDGAPTRVRRAAGDPFPIEFPPGDRPTRLIPIALGPDGRLYMLAPPSRLILYDLNEGKVIADRREPNVPWSSAGLSPDRKELYVPAGPGHKGLFRVVDAATLKDARTVPGEYQAWAGRAAVSPDGKAVAVTDGHCVRIVDAATGKDRFPELVTGHVTAVGALRVDARGRFVAAMDMRGVRLWELPGGKPLRSVTILAPHDVHLSPDGAWVAFPGPRSAELVDTATGKERISIPTPKGYFAGFTPGGNLRLWDAAGGPKGPTTVREIDPLTRKEVRADVVLAGYTSYAPSVAADGSVVVIPKLGHLDVWRKGAEPLQLPSPAANGNYSGQVGDFRHRAITPDGRVFATNRENFESVEVWRLDESAWVGRSAVADPPAEAGVVGAVVAGVASLPRLRLIREDPPLPEPRGRPRPARVSALAVSPDGRLVAVGCTDGLVRVWEAVSLAERFRFRPGAGGVGAVAFTPDGGHILAASRDTTVTVWDVAALDRADPPAGAKPADLWDLLAHPDPVVAAGAVRGLAADPATVERLEGKFAAPVVRPVAALITDLGDAVFATRERAEDELVKLGPRAIAALTAAAVRAESPEVRRRAASALQRIRGTPLGPQSWLTPGQVRAVRAVEVLERVGSGDAKDLLREWAKEHAGTMLGSEAAAALARLDAR